MAYRSSPLISAADVGDLRGVHDDVAVWRRTFRLHRFGHVVHARAFGVLSPTKAPDFHPKDQSAPQALWTRGICGICNKHGALIIGAFFVGDMRATLLRNQAQHMVVTKEFTGKASVIASSEGALLLFQKQEQGHRYIYSAPEFTATIDIEQVPRSNGTKKEPAATVTGE
jgi:hypothetical protein